MDRILQTLLTKCYNYLERSLRSWWMWHGPRWNLLSYVTKNGNRGHMIRNLVREVREVRGERGVLSQAKRTTYPVITIGRSYVFKGPQSLPR